MAHSINPGSTSATVSVDAEIICDVVSRASRHVAEVATEALPRIQNALQPTFDKANEQFGCREKTNVAVMMQLGRAQLYLSGEASRKKIRDLAKAAAKAIRHNRARREFEAQLDRLDTATNVPEHVPLDHPPWVSPTPPKQSPAPARGPDTFTEGRSLAHLNLLPPREEAARGRVIR